MKWLEVSENNLYIFLRNGGLLSMAKQASYAGQRGIASMPRPPSTAQLLIGRLPLSRAPVIPPSARKFFTVFLPKFSLVQ